MVRKIPPELENPIDNGLIDLAEDLAPLHKQLNMTPNMLTTISLLLAFLSAGLIYNEYYKLGAIVFLSSYFYDILDGHYARKYDMVTRFGDYYDHFADIFKIVLIGFVIYLKSSTHFYLFLIITILFAVLFSIHLGYQEIYYDSEESETLEYFKIFAQDDPEVMLPYTRYVGVGTYIMLVVILIFTM